LKSGRAWDKFVEWITAQGGDRSMIEQPDRLPHATIVREVNSDQAGYIRSINALEVGLTSVDLGAGRAQTGDPIDYAVGILLHVKVGDAIELGRPLFTIHANDQARAIAAEERLRRAIHFSAEAVKPLPLFYGVVS
jgi:thymidine phosphorylase